MSHAVMEKADNGRRVSKAMGSIATHVKAFSAQLQRAQKPKPLTFG
jgi:hypothetical protein